jgi:hypothetical protein
MTKKSNQATEYSNPFQPRVLTFKRGTSRAQDTYGYARVTLTDCWTGKKLACCGGGYDMTGHCLGEWMMANLQDRLDALKPGTKTVGDYQRPLYGIQYKGLMLSNGHVYTSASVDGSCGLSSMVDIARACGIVIDEIWDRSTRNGTLIGFTVREVAP